MGTRGVVAVRTGPKTWKGVYNHWDSYPTGLGADVWAEITEHGIEKVAKEMLKYGDWREYKSKGICEYCGQKVGQPHSISGKIISPASIFSPELVKKYADIKTPGELTAKLLTEPTLGRDPHIIARSVLQDFDIFRALAETGYPDPKAEHHSHGQGKVDQITNETTEALWHEWVYVLDTKKKLVEVWMSVANPDVPPLTNSSREFYHVKVTEVHVEGRDPDWAVIQGSANDFRERLANRKVRRAKPPRRKVRKTKK